MTNTAFSTLPLNPEQLSNIQALGYEQMTPIQAQGLPVILEGKDILAQAKTGSGKTAAFAIGLLHKLDVTKYETQALVLCPTRELADQVSNEIRRLARAIPNTKILTLCGGKPLAPQLASLEHSPHIVVGTPGRILKHLIDKQSLNLEHLNTLVLDEADRMLDMGFLPQIEHILRAIPKNRQTMLFSATIPGTVVRIATAHMKLPVHVEIAPSGTAAERIIQELFIVKQGAKKQLLEKLLNQYHGPVLLFSRTKRGARSITRLIRHMGHSAAEIHSDRSQGQRKEALDGFKTGRYRILVATDIAARGIDVIGIELVINLKPLLF